jgi:tripartite-type tricarboxylate transporter receptor subunit TctC
MMESFARKTRIHLAHVPYQNNSQVTTALLSHPVQAAFMPPSGALAQAEAGKLRMLAVSSVRRWPQRPEVPTLAEETGIDDLRGEVRMAAFGPVATQADAAARLNAAINTVLLQPHIRQRLNVQGWQVLGGGPGELRTRMAGDTALWARVIREANIPAE